MNKLYFNGSIALYGFLARSGWISRPVLMLTAPSTGSCGSSGGDPGIFAPVLDKLLPLARNAWAFGVALLIVIAKSRRSVLRTERCSRRFGGRQRDDQ